jgi:hypothetical protein
MLGAEKLKPTASACGWERGPCMITEHNDKYFVMRSLAAEVNMLAKFLSMPGLTNDTNAADFFLVPWLCGTDQMLNDNAWGGGPLGTRLTRLLSFLHAFHGEHQRRHLFLCSTGHRDVPSDLRQLIKKSGAILFDYGPRHMRNEVVIAPNSAGFGAPLQPILDSPKHYVFFLAGQIPIRSPVQRQISEYRELMRSEVNRLKAEHPELSIESWKITGTRDHFSLSILDAIQKMQNSLLCPIPIGDLPFEHRFFDALFAGCLPVMIRYKGDTKEGCETWSWSKRKVTESGGMVEENGCVNDTYPFTSAIDYASISLAIDSEDFQIGRFAEALLRIDPAIIRQKRKSLEGLRKHFIYDWTGSTDDAFGTKLFHEVCKLLPSDEQIQASELR